MSDGTAVDVLGVSHYVCFTPVSGVMAAQRDPAVREALNGAGLLS